MRSPLFSANDRCCSKASFKRYQISKMAVEHYGFWTEVKRTHLRSFKLFRHIGYRKSKIENRSKCNLRIRKFDFSFARSFYRGFNFIVLWNYLGNSNCTPIPRICYTFRKETSSLLSYAPVPCLYPYLYLSFPNLSLSWWWMKLQWNSSLVVQRCTK